MSTVREVEHRTLRWLEQRTTGAAGGSRPRDREWTCAFRTWPAPGAATARRLAAQANAARGRELLWIIGTDPRTGKTPGADVRRVEPWWAALRPCFEGLTPQVDAWEVPVGDGNNGAHPVVALRIETGRAPFLVRRGTTGGLEVPWADLVSEGDANPATPRSATRADLIKLLSPLTDLPRFELLEAELNFYKNPHAASGRLAGAAGATFRWSLDACVYVLPGGGGRVGEEGPGRVVIPRHRCRGAVELAGVAGAGAGDLHADATDLSLTPDKGSSAVRVTESAVLVEGLGRFFIYLCGSTRHPAPGWGEPATLRLDFQPAGAERVATAIASLHPEPTLESNQAGRWKL